MRVLFPFFLPIFSIDCCWEKTYQVQKAIYTSQWSKYVFLKKVQRNPQYFETNSCLISFRVTEFFFHWCFWRCLGRRCGASVTRSKCLQVQFCTHQHNIMDWKILCVLKTTKFDTREFYQFGFKEQRTCILSTYLFLFCYWRDVVSSWLWQQVSCHSFHHAHHHFVCLSITCQVVRRGCVSQGVEICYRFLPTFWSIICWMLFMLYSLTLYRILTLFKYQKSKCANTHCGKSFFCCIVEVLLFLCHLYAQFLRSKICFLQGTQIHFISKIEFFVNLSNYFFSCMTNSYQKHLSPLQVAVVLIPSLFVGLLQLLQHTLCIFVRPQV